MGDIDGEGQNVSEWLFLEILAGGSPSSPTKWNLGFSHSPIIKKQKVVISRYLIFSPFHFLNKILTICELHITVLRRVVMPGVSVCYQLNKLLQQEREEGRVEPNKWTLGYNVYESRVRRTTVLYQHSNQPETFNHLENDKKIRNVFLF